MARPTYTARVIVVRKTKLGESDLILTLLAEDGSQLRAVAKGARKPKSSFASRLELFSVADVLCAKGRSLDVVSEARLVEGNAALRGDIERTSAAAPIAELVERTTQAGLECPNLFAMTQTALRTMCDSDAAGAPSIAAGHLLKAFAMTGVRPVLSECAACGNPVTPLPDGSLAFSPREGGVICSHCRAHTEAGYIDAQTAEWSNFLLRSTFSDIAGARMGVREAFSVLDLCQRWCLEHVGCRLRSLSFMFTSGLYESK